MTKIRVAVIDDNEDFLTSITKYLNRQKDILVDCAVTNKAQALLLPNLHDIDIMLIDVNLTENKCDGIYVADQIRSLYPQKPKIIMLTEYNDCELIEKSSLAGVAYYMLKTSFKLLPDTIKNVYNNNFPAETVFQGYSDVIKNKMLKDKFLLSDAEITIYKYAEKGHKQSKIIENLHISESTYKKHVNSILKKFRATSIKHAIKKFKEISFTKDILINSND